MATKKSASGLPVDRLSPQEIFESPLNHLEDILKTVPYDQAYPGREMKATEEMWRFKNCRYSK